MTTTALIKEEKDLPALAKQRGIELATWNALKTSIFPGASDESVVMAMDYCAARKLDPLKKPVHIVPVWNQAANNGRGGNVETIWPSITEVRITAMRTGEFGGREATQWGDVKSHTWEYKDKDKDKSGKWVDRKLVLEFPEWAQVTVYKYVKGQRCEFVGPKVFWMETFASAKGGVPNSMWRKRPRGQLEKCAEAAALRAAFPEEIGNDYTVDEMAGQAIDVEQVYAGERPEAPQREAGAATTHTGEETAASDPENHPAPAKKSARRSAKKTPAKAAPPPAKAVDEKEPQKVSEIEDGKDYTGLRCMVAQMKELKQGETPVMGLKLTGDYEGAAYDIKPDDPYPVKEGDPATVDLLGKKKRDGGIAAIVQRIEMRIDF